MKKTTFVIFLVVVTVITTVALTIVSISSKNDTRISNPTTEIIQTVTSSLTEDSLPEQTQSGYIIQQELRYDNIQIFLLNGLAEIPGDRYLTLDMALEAKQVEVLETSDVNELKINNLSDKYIYINSGDIVRGGKQDRTIQYDIIVSPKAKNVPLASFCVESGRWNPRDQEGVLSFSSSKNSLSHKDLKVAAKMEKNQREVWNKVEEYQNKSEVSASYLASDEIKLKDDKSPTSLELTLENKEFKKLKETYKTALLNQIKDKNHIVGMAVYINGALASMDIYNNQKLFNDLFNKLLEAAISEAISEKKKTAITYVSDDKVKSLLKAEFKIRSTEKVNDITTFVTSTLNHQLMFSTFDLSVNKWLHYNWLETNAQIQDRPERH